MTMPSNSNFVEVTPSSTDQHRQHHEQDPLLDGRVIVVDTSNTTPLFDSSPKSVMTCFDSVEDKVQAICDCLQLHGGSHTMDLWELRELALSRGGLLSPSLRQLAWPKLVGISAAMNLAAATPGNAIDDDSTATATNTVLDSDVLVAMKQDIASTVWQVSALMRQSNTGKDTFWFAPLQVTDDEAPGLALSSPCSNSESGSEEDSHNQAHRNGVVESPVKASPVKASGGGLSANEQMWLEQVLTQVLLPTQNGLNSKYYQPGLANLAALIMVNLESTSLTARFLSQLATYSLYATFAGGSSVASIPKMLSILMKEFCPKSKMEPTEFTNKVVTWFASEKRGTYHSPQVTSRILDAFIVAHPLFPLYFASATSESTAPWTMDSVESSIRAALRYMEELPPAQLVALSKVDYSIPTTPAWAFAATSTTDWALIAKSHSGSTSTIPSLPSSPAKCQQADPFLDDDTDADWERLSSTSVDEISDCGDDEPVAPPQEAHFYELYSNAMTAAGVNVASTKNRSALMKQKRTRARCMLVQFSMLALFVVTAALAAWSRGYFEASIPATTSLPSKEPVTVPAVRIANDTPRPTPKPVEHLVATVPYSKWSVMVRKDATKTQQSSSTAMTPESEKILQKYMLEGFVHSMGLEPYVDSSLDTLRELKSAVVPTPSPPKPEQAVSKFDPKLKLLRPIVRQLQKLGNILRKVVALVIRPRKKGLQQN